MRDLARFRRGLVMALLALGVIGGYASGFHSLRAHLHGHSSCACHHDDGNAPR